MILHTNPLYPRNGLELVGTWSKQADSQCRSSFTIHTRRRQPPTIGGLIRPPIVALDASSGDSRNTKDTDADVDMNMHKLHWA